MPIGKNCAKYGIGESWRNVYVEFFTFEPRMLA